jgi:hypothetical protein
MGYIDSLRRIDPPATAGRRVVVRCLDAINGI